MFTMDPLQFGNQLNLDCAHHQSNQRLFDVMKGLMRKYQSSSDCLFLLTFHLSNIEPQTNNT